MGITLTYKPTPVPSPEVFDIITAEIRECGPIEQWWSEPIRLLKSPTFGVLGMTKVSIPGYSTEQGTYIDVLPQDDFLMMWRDIHKIAGMLATWSKRFNLSWNFDLEGGHFGNVLPSGHFDQELVESLEQLCQMADAPSSPEARDARITEIDKKHSDRW
jgi:hypothetical protein